VKKGHLSQFVEEAVRDRLLDLTVAEVKERNVGQTDLITHAVDEAIERA